MQGITLIDFDLKVEPLLDNDNKIMSGLVLGDVLRQNQALILMLNQGELKERPEVGVGIENMLLSNDPLYWRTIIAEQLEADKQKVVTIKITRQGIVIDASY